jgi:hypothetical protein
MLSNLLAMGGWYEGRADLVYLAGRLLVDVFPDLSTDQPPIIEGSETDGKAVIDQPKMREWLGQTFDLTVSPREFATVKQCIQYHIASSKLTVNRFVIELMDTFELSPPVDGE